jgi:hypothetical protein
MTILVLNDDAAAGLIAKDGGVVARSCGSRN